MPGVVGSRVAVQCGLHSLAIHERAPVSHLNEHVAVFAMPDVSHYSIAFEGQSRLRRICPTDVYFWGEGIHGEQRHCDYQQYRPPVHHIKHRTTVGQFF